MKTRAKNVVGGGRAARSRVRVTVDGVDADEHLVLASARAAPTSRDAAAPPAVRTRSWSDGPHRRLPAVQGQDDVAGLLPASRRTCVASTTSSSGYVRSITARYSPASMQLLEEEDVLPLVPRRRRAAPARCRAARVAASGAGRPGTIQSPSVETKIPPGTSEPPAARPNECLPTASKMTSYVSPFFVKSSPLVVDDLVGAERADELDVLRAAHRRHVRAEMPRELDGGRARRDPEAP